MDLKRKVFITGIAGFIGSQLALRLAETGHHVEGCDNFNDYYSPKLKHLRAEELNKKGVKIHLCDICEIFNLRAHFEKEKFTHFVHLAAQAGVRYSLKEPRKYVDANLRGFVEVLELCRALQPLPFFFASSSSIYGSSDKDSFSETDMTDRPLSLYGATKKANELIAHSYHYLYGIPMTGLRFFTVYGPWGRPDMAYFSFTKKILKGEPIEVFNKGEMYRDFTYIDDILEGIEAALESPSSFEIFNLGNSRPVKLTAFIQTLEECIGQKAQIRWAPLQEGDVLATSADITKSRGVLGFSPKTPLDKGLEKFVAWYRAYSCLF